MFRRSGTPLAILGRSGCSMNGSENAMLLGSCSVRINPGHTSDIQAPLWLLPLVLWVPLGLYLAVLKEPCGAGV